MDRSKSAQAASFVLFLSIAAACGGQLADTADEPMMVSATDVGRADAAAAKPGSLPCPAGVRAGVSCGSNERHCTDDSTCSTPRYVCKGGTWQVESESSCSVQKKSPCPTDTPSEEDWCPEPQAECSYPDSCSERPSFVAPMRTYECTGSRWTWVSGRYDVTCPKVAPENAAPCEPTCRYGDCVFDDACGSATFTCEPRSGTWHRVSGSLCPTADAGAD